MFKKNKQGQSEAPSYLRPYAEAAKAFGQGFETMLWQNRQGQQKRFQVITDLIEPELHTIADFGCGRADLLDFLVDAGMKPAGYVGIDGISDMHAAATARIQELDIPNTRAILADFMAEESIFARAVNEFAANAFVFSGSLNTLSEPQARDLLERAWAALPKHGRLVFNFLSDRFSGSSAAGPAHRFSTSAMTNWALDQTPLVQLRHDYFDGHDATILMRVP